MSSPVPLRQLSLFLKQMHRCFTFQPPHDLGYGILGRNGDHKVNMVRLYVDLLYGYLIFLAAEFVEVVTNNYFSFSFQNIVSILGAKYDMIGAQPDAVG